METERLSRLAFNSLLEYSCSVPTGFRPGKVWRCNLNAYRPGATGELWIIREYLEDGSIEDRLPEIVDDEEESM